MQRKKLPPGAVSKNAPDETFIAYAQTRTRETEAELEKRLNNCDEILRAIHKAIPRLTGRFLRRSEMPYVNVKSQHIKDILKTFLPGGGVLDKNIASTLARRAKYWRLQDRGGPWEQCVGKLYRHLPGRYSKKCPLTSELVTALATYLWQCQNIRTYLTVPQRYSCIGQIVSAVALPACLLCGRKHQFRTWQAVMKLDRYRNERQPSQEEKESLLLNKAEDEFIQAKEWWERHHGVKLEETFQEPWRSLQERLRKERTQALLKDLPKSTKS